MRKNVPRKAAPSKKYINNNNMIQKLFFDSNALPKKAFTVALFIMKN